MARKTITTWAELEADLDAEKKALVEIEPAMELTAWVVDTGYAGCWHAEWTPPLFSDGSISRVACDGLFLTVRTSLAACEANPGSYYYDAASMFVHVHAVDSLSPATHTVTAYCWLYVATHPACIFTPAQGSLPAYYEPLVAKAPAYSSTLNTDFFAAVSSNFGSLELLNGASADYDNMGPLDDIFYSLIWIGKTVRVLVGGEALPYSEYKVALTGEITRQSKTSERATFTVTEPQVFSAKLPLTTYYTTADYPNLDPNAEGRLKPIIYGTVCNVTPTQVDTTGWVFKLAGHGLTAITAVREDGVDITSNATMDLAGGGFTLSAYAGGQLTCDCTGYDLHLYGEIATSLLTTYGGRATADIDTAALATVDTARPYALGIVIAELKTIGDILSEMDESIMAWHGRNRAGQVTARAWVEPSLNDAGIVTYDGDYDMRDAAEEVLTDRLYYKVQVGYQRNWTVQQQTSSAGMTITISGTTYDIDQSPRQNWSHTERWEDAESSRCRYLYGCNEILPVRSLLTAQADAAAIAALYLVLVERPWVQQSFKTQLKPLGQHLGGSVIMNRLRFCIGADKSMLITGLREGLSENLAEVTAFKKL